MPLVYWPSLILKRPAEVVEDTNSPELEGIIKRMYTTLDAEKGAGLAAPQVGVPRRLLVWRTPKGDRHMINPSVVELMGTDEVDYEGCLSFPALALQVKRNNKVAVSFVAFGTGDQRVTEVFSGIEARVIQHEIDHLDGKTFLSYLPKLKADLITTKINKLRKRLGKKK